MIRKAAGLWARRGVAAWSQRSPDPAHLLIGETPLVGHRFVELARRAHDEAEALLAGPMCRFVIAVPSREVRSFLEAERERRTASPLHPREREDAPPQVLRDLWRDLAALAPHFGIAPPTPAPPARNAPLASEAPRTPGDVPYDPEVYRRVYAAILRQRRVETVALDTVLPTGARSVYDFGFAALDVTPSEAEADAMVREVERRYPDPAAIEHEIATWWDVSGPMPPP